MDSHNVELHQKWKRKGEDEETTHLNIMSRQEAGVTEDKTEFNMFKDMGQNEQDKLNQ